ncbi:MAG: acetyltransferase [Nocardioidaceae bacterium]|nr:acetyltransferase [Nocardioidaceae bacterium]
MAEAPSRDPLHVIGVASPYAWDVVESVRRSGRSAVCVDNHGGADPRLPGLRSLGDDVRPPWVLGLSSAVHRAAAASSLGPGLGEAEVLVDPTAVVASTASVAHGGYVNAGSVVASHAVLGCYAHVNRSASVGHDCVLDFAASLGPGVVLAGAVRVGSATFVGAGSVVLPGVVIGARAVVGAGAVVTRDVPDDTVVVGNPARVLRETDPHEVPRACPHCSTT